MSDVIADFYRMIAERRARYGPPLTEIKLTQAEMDKIKATVGVVDNPLPLTAFLAVPVVLVDKPEDSTLFMMTWESLVERLRAQS